MFYFWKVSSWAYPTMWGKLKKIYSDSKDNCYLQNCMLSYLCTDQSWCTDSAGRVSIYEFKLFFGYMMHFI